MVDPFFGSGTTGAVAKKLHRHFIGIEQDANYIAVAKKRLEAIMPAPLNQAVFDVRDKKRLAARIPFAQLLEQGLLQPGQSLYFRKDPKKIAYIKPDGQLIYNQFEGSIHKIGKQIMNGSPCNGWEHWYFENSAGELETINKLREIIRAGE